MAPRNPTVLVVTEDREPSEAISAWLQKAGMRVIACPGPQAPSHVCAAGRGQPCPLATGADVVVLDLWLASDTMLRGTPALQLLSYYLDLAKPVIALQRLGGPPVRSSARASRWCPGRRRSARWWRRSAAGFPGHSATPRRASPGDDRASRCGPERGRILT